MALLDARALIHALQQSDTPEQALPRYAASRRRHVRTFQAMSAMFTPFYQSDSAWLPWMRDQLAARLSMVPPAPQLLARMVAGTLVDPFTSIGLKEHDWNAAPNPRSQADRAQPEQTFFFICALHGRTCGCAAGNVRVPRASSLPSERA
jgi:hypothetical protein